MSVLRALQPRRPYHVVAYGLPRDVSERDLISAVVGCGAGVSVAALISETLPDGLRVCFFNLESREDVAKLLTPARRQYVGAGRSFFGAPRLSIAQRVGLQGSRGRARSLVMSVHAPPPVWAARSRGSLCAGRCQRDVQCHSCEPRGAL